MEENIIIKIDIKDKIVIYREIISRIFYIYVFFSNFFHNYYLWSIYYREMIGNAQIVFKIKIALRWREDPRMIKDLSNSDSFASWWNEQAVYQVPALDRCLTHGFFLNWRQAPVDLDHQSPSTLLRRCPFVAGTQKRKSTNCHSVQNDSSVYHIVT